MFRFAMTFAACITLAGTAFADDRDTCREAEGERSLRACNRVIESKRTSRTDLADAHNNRGQYYYKLRELDRAQADFTHAIRINDLALAYGNRGNVSFLRDDYDGAIADYTRAIARDHRYTSAYTSRGLMHEKKGNLASARADWSAALAVPPKFLDGQWAHDTARRALERTTKK
jgi:tetratricopeptide (TPR) repeat protein